MCTAMTLETAQGEVYLGRTMDFSVTFGSEPFILFQRGIGGGIWLLRIRSGTNIVLLRWGRMLLRLFFVDGVNEKGFGAAVFVFSGLCVL